MLIKNYQTNINKTLNNTDISQDTSTINTFNGIKYPTSNLSVFNIYNNEDIIKLIEEQKKFVKKEADLYFKYGWLSKISYEQTIKQYDNLFYFNGYFYLQSEVKEYIANNIRISGTTEFDIYSEKANTITKQIYEISRQAIRNITGYNPYFTPTIRKGPTTYVERQDKLIEDEHKLVLVLGSRQIGKSFSIAEKAVEESHIPNNDILVGAFRVASTDNIRKYIRKFIRNFSEGYFEEFKAERYFLNTKTGSKIYFRTLSEENEAVEAVRGMTLNTIIVDEAQLVTEYAYEEILRPTLATTAGKMILIGTPPKTTNGYFVEKIFQYKKGLLPKASYYEIKLQDQPFTDPETREEMMNRQDEPRIQRERFCNLMTESEQLFKPTISHIYPPQSNEYFYVLTIDPARLGDRSGYVINQIGNGKVSTILSGFVPDSHKKDWTLQASFFKKLIINYPNIIIGMDISGVGDGVYTIFKQAGLKINYTIRYTSGQTLSVKQTESTNYTVAKSILINTFLDFISEDQLEIIELTNKDLIEELSYIQEDQTRTGIISFKSRFYDDITNAEMINLFIIKERKLLGKTNKQPSYLPSSNHELIDAIEGLGQSQQQYSSMW